MTKRLKLEYDLASESAGEQLLKTVLLENQGDLSEFFRHHLPHDDVRYDVLDGNMEIEELSVDLDGDGRASLRFDYNYYEGCKDRDFVDSMDVSIVFKIKGGKLVVDTEFPPAWEPSDVY